MSAQMTLVEDGSFGMMDSEMFFIDHPFLPADTGTLPLSKGKGWGWGLYIELSTIQYLKKFYLLNPICLFVKFITAIVLFVVSCGVCIFRPKSKKICESLPGIDTEQKY